MKKITWNTKILSLILMLTLLVGIVPMNGIVSFAVEAEEHYYEPSEEEPAGAVSVSVDGETNYYSSLRDAIDNSVDGALITLHDNIDEDGEVQDVHSDITIDLNGFAFGGISFRVFSGVTVKDSSDDGSGRINQNPGICVFNVYKNELETGSLTIESGTFEFNSIMIDDGASVVISGGLFEKNVQFSCAFDETKGSVSISGGTFVKGIDAKNVNLSSLLADGYAFWDENCNLVNATVSCYTGWLIPVLHECSFDNYVPIEDKHVVGCIYCDKKSNELLDHVPSNEVYCTGTVCEDCGVYFGEVAADVHLDDDSNDRCDLCGEFYGNIISEITGRFVVHYETTEGENAYIKLTVSEEGRYHFYSDLTEGDPVGALYNSSFSCLADNDDSDNDIGRNFEFEVYLEPGVYYLCVYPLGETLSADILGRKLCDTHVEGGSPTCIGIICSVCGDAFGNVDEDNHDLSDEQICQGNFCKLCGGYFGEASVNNHLDDNDDRLCDFCGNNCITADITATDNVSLNIVTSSSQSYFIEFTVTVAGKYEIYSELNYGDPRVWLYNSDIYLLEYNDDYSGLDFRIERELEVGVYFIEVKGYSGDFDIKVYANLKCEEHTSSGVTNCLGTLCSVCSRYYGEKNDNHDLSDEQTCKGYFCSVCEKYAGEKGDNHVFEEEQTCIGTYCSFCELDVGEGNDNHYLSDKNTCRGRLCYYCSEYVGEPNGDHTIVGDVTCIGSYCSICETYVGEANEGAHTFVDTTCEGDYCDICKQYIGESVDHIDEDDNNYCDNCSAFIPAFIAEMTVGSSITTAVNHKNESDVYVKFVPCETAEYVIYAISDIDSYLRIYDRKGELITYNDDSGVNYNFRLSMKFVAGETYYFGLSRYSTVGDITVYLNENCKNNIHGEPMFVDCQRFYCSNCSLEIKETSDNHIDMSASFGFCDVCTEFIPNPAQTITVGDYVVDVPFYSEGALFLEFVPTESGLYIFRANSECEPYVGIWYEHGVCDYISYDNPTPLYQLNDTDVYLEVELAAGSVYYISLQNEICRGNVTLSVNKACDENHGSDTIYCEGYYCDTCSMFVDYESNNHIDINADQFCDVCDNMYLVPDATMSASEIVTVTVQPDEYYIVKFIPEKDGIYRFKSNSNSDPKAAIYDSEYCLLYSADDENGLNFVLEIQLEAGSTYYLAVGSYDSAEQTFTVSVERECLEHTPTGEQTCEGYKCAECDVFFGDALDHDMTVTENNPYYHWVACSACGYYEESFFHEYNDSRVCECGRQASNDVYVGGILIADGQYIDTNGNVGTTKPQGGYAYYNDGVLTLNNFDATVEEEFIEDVGAVIFAERDLVIILEGESILETCCDDVIDVAYGDLTIKGDGIIILNTLESDDDGIDVACGSLIIESGSILIYAYDDGIETDADVIVNGGVVYIFCDDEGVNVFNDFVITAGMVVIDAYDDGVDADNNIIIECGTLIIEADDLGLVSELVYIEGGRVTITSYDASVSSDEFEMTGGSLIITSTGYGGIDSYGVTISGGTLNIHNGSAHGIISYGEDITITGGDIEIFAVSAAVLALEGAGINIADGLSDLNVTLWSDSLTLGDENGFATHVVIGSEKNVIEEYFVYVGSDCTYYDGVVDMTIRVLDYVRDTELELGVHYTVEPLSGEINGQGVYYYLISGIGEYIGEVVVSVGITEVHDAQMGENILSASDINGLFKVRYNFVALETARHRFTFFGNHVVFVAYANGNLISVITSVDENGNIYFEHTFVKGEAYEILIFVADTDDGGCRFVVEYNCDEHVGGTATYHDRAVCNICGEEYGNVLVCDPHVGGTATYTDRAVCENCGEEYGDILVCDPHVGGTATYTDRAVCINCGEEYGDILHCSHLCHKGGLYAIIWDLFEYIYDMLGIETECECGISH